MSFETSPIRMPYIQNPQFVQNNGGGGNLGYMQQEKKKKKEEEEKKLLAEDDADVLQLDSEADFKDKFEETTKDEPSAGKWFGKMAEKIGEKISEKLNPQKENPFTNTTF